MVMEVLRREANRERVQPNEVRHLQISIGVGQRNRFKVGSGSLREICSSFRGEKAVAAMFHHERDSDNIWAEQMVIR